MMAAQFVCDGIGTRWWFELLDTETFPDILKNAITETIEEFDSDYSRFIPTSYIGRLNTQKHIVNPPKELQDMMSFARQMFYDSDGAFNISVGGKLHEQGYGSRALSAQIDPTVWDKTQIDDRRITIPPAVVIDNGGFGKGWLIDRIGAQLQQQGYHQFVINGGGDMLVKSTTPIRIGLEDPNKPGRYIGSISITDGALAASSNNKRNWVHDGNTYHHIIDPRENTDTVFPSGTFVRAKTALIADTMATILLLEPRLKEALSARYNLSAMILL